MSSRSTGRSQRVAIRQGLPVWEIDAACTAECRHSALFGTLNPAPVKRYFVGAARAGRCSRRSVYARTHPSGRAVGVPPASTARDSCTVRPQSHSAKNPSQDYVTVRQIKSVWLHAVRQLLSSESSDQTKLQPLSSRRLKQEEDRHFSQCQERDSIVPSLLQIYISNAYEIPLHARIVLQCLLEPSLLSCPTPHADSPHT